jgi:pyruvate dehydrogenase E2 component (dihydrolipoamide acetyltransferase)
MAYIVRMPKLGMEMDEGELLEWKVDGGERVEAGQVIAEIESEKSVADVEAREDGVLRSTVLDPGETVEPGTPMGIVAGPDDDVSGLVAEIESGGADAVEEGGGAESPVEETGADSTATDATAAATAGVRASPRARRRAGELGLELATIEGTGPRGAVTADDVEAAAAARDPSDTGSEATATGADGPAVAEERSLSGMRRTIGDRLGRSYREAVHVTLHRDVRVDETVAAAGAADSALDADVSVTDVLLVALSEALSEHPAFNATFEDGTHRIYADQNVGVAVDVEEGLVAPVLRGIGDRSLADLAASRREVTERTLAGEYAMDDLAGGTFTVTNLGVLGVDAFDPIIDPPQVAILGVGRIRDRPTAVEGEVAVRSWMGLDLSFDHRVVDGADGARFLDTLADHLQRPWELLFDRV